MCGTVRLGRVAWRAQSLDAGWVVGLGSVDAECLDVDDVVELIDDPGADVRVVGCALVVLTVAYFAFDGGRDLAAGSAVGPCHDVYRLQRRAYAARSAT